MTRPPLADPKAVLRGAASSRVGPVALAFAAGAALAAVKVGVHRYGLEIAVVGIPVLAALLGAVVFTLAIVLSGVLADFKEAERGLGELVSTVRRLHWDFAFSGADDGTVAQLRAQLGHFVHMVLANAKDGFRWRLRDLHSPIDAMDQLLVAGAAANPKATTRTSQMGLATLTRNVDRLEVIVETTFMQAGYAFSGTAIALVLACFMATGLGSAASGALVVGAVAFVLVGLFLIVRDLDNPMAGSVRVDLRQLEKLAAFLKERAAAEAGDGRIVVHAASGPHQEQATRLA